MPYIGSAPAQTALTAAHIDAGAVDSSEIATGAVDIAHLSASGTAGSGNFLRGDNSWQAAGLALGSTPASVQVFTSTGTWTRPTGILNVVVYVVGGGGGGGGPGSTNGGGGGGGGGTAIELLDVSSTSTAAVTIGAAGSAGSGGNGGDGGTSSFASFCSATRSAELLIPFCD